MPNFIECDERLLMRAIDWREDTVVMFGRSIKVPRLCAWYGDPGVEYRYSNVVHRADGWPAEIAILRDRIHQLVGARFNFVLANLYRDGHDAIGWHSDDERDLGPQPCIASLSFGASRPFRIRSRDGRRRVELLMEHGSLLLMFGTSQKKWQHSLPRIRTDVGPRINLTFRDVRVNA